MVTITITNEVSDKECTKMLRWEYSTHKRMWSILAYPCPYFSRKYKRFRICSDTAIVSLYFFLESAKTNKDLKVVIWLNRGSVGTLRGIDSKFDKLLKDNYTGHKFDELMFKKEYKDVAFTRNGTWIHHGLEDLPKEESQKILIAALTIGLRGYR